VRFDQFKHIAKAVTHNYVQKPQLQVLILAWNYVSI